MDDLEMEKRLRYAAELLADVHVALRDIESLPGTALIIRAIGQQCSDTSNQMMAKRLADLVLAKNETLDEIRALPEYRGER